MRTKVFVGNLSFATKENELSKEFEAAGKVISANIITRGPRSLGYGFVEMDNEQDAEKAVQLLDKKEIDGRPINVEVAKPREEGAENAEKPQGSTRGGRGGRGGRGSRGGFRGSRGGARGAPRGGSVGASGDAQPRRRNNFRREDEGEEGSQQQQQEGQQSGEGKRGGRRGRGTRGGARGGQPRPQRDEKREDTRTPSQTTLFVANLPFTLETEGFENILKESQLAYKSAHVVKKKTGRSKGFGFVEFENESDQQKALAAINNKQVEGRELVAKVALTENKPVEGETTATTATDAKTSTPKVENKTTTASPKTEKQ